MIARKLQCSILCMYLSNCITIMIGFNLEQHDLVAIADSL